MNIIEIINKKREKGSLTKEELDYVISNYMNNNIKDYQMSALLMAICINGMSEDEIINLASIMLHSGDVFDLSSVEGIKVDKHSTGGVGDKTTLVVAPLVASCGLVVAKMSGRGLGHTGGTIDKLEAIEGFNVNLSNEVFIKQLKEIGVAITTSSMNIAPADKKLYALRDVTGTVCSIPLIASSIMSKKLATNADKIVIDVKVGKGALIKNVDDANNIANLMIKIGNTFGKKVVVLITNMNAPLGNSIGNSLEVKEAIETLNGKGDSNFRDLCIAIASQMVSIGKNIDIEASLKEVKDNLDNGNAYKKFLSFIKAQNGNIEKIVNANKQIAYKAISSGYLNHIDALILGDYVMNLGAGRKNKDDVIDYGVGLVLKCMQGQYINEGEVLATIYYNSDLIDLSTLDKAFIIENDKKELEPLIYSVIM